MSFYIHNLKGHNPFFNLAFEEYIFSEMAKDENDIYLVLYENKDSVILGKNLVKEKETYSHKKLPPVIKRASGGGSVVHFYGNLNYGLILNVNAHPEFEAIQKSYEIILNCLASCLNAALQFKPDGISDLCIVTERGLRKISGNSQVRRKKWLLHHGTLLYNTANIHKISQYLQHPPKEPDYRKGKKHEDFLIKYLPNTTSSEIRKKLINGFSARFATQTRILKITPRLKKNATIYLNQILHERYIAP